MLTQFEINERFSEAYDSLMKNCGYSQLLVMATGGGMDVARVATYPGSSSRIAAILHPYDMRELWALVEPIAIAADPKATLEGWRSVHAESAAIYLHALRRQYKRDLFYVASTAALETTRRRRGKNVSYVATQVSEREPLRVWEILLDKMEDHPVYRSTGEPGNLIMTSPTPEERWKELFMTDGKVDMSVLASARACQDSKISRCILQLILDDKDFFPCLVDNDRITLLSEDGKPVNQVWLEGKCDR